MGREEIRQILIAEGFRPYALPKRQPPPQSKFDIKAAEMKKRWDAIREREYHERALRAWKARRKQ